MTSCPTCWTKWGRDLWQGSCLCVPGIIPMPFVCPGVLIFNPEIKDLSKDGKRITPKTTKKATTPQPQEFTLF